MSKSTLSPTSLGTWQRCQVQYEYRYLKGMKIPPGIAMLVGTSVHEGAAGDLNAKLDTGELLPLEHVHDLVRDAFTRKTTDEPYDLKPEEKAQGKEAVIAKNLDTTIQLATAYHGTYAPMIRPVRDRIEWGFKIVTDLDHDLIGYIDVVDEVEFTGERRIRDLKTKAGGKAPAEKDVATSIQLDIYHLASKVIDGIEPSAVMLDFLVPQAKGIKQVTYTTTRSDDDMEVLFKRVAAASQGIGTGVYQPADPEKDWWCSARFCGYAQICPYFKRPKSVVLTEYPTLKQAGEDAVVGNATEGSVHGPTPILTGPVPKTKTTTKTKTKTKRKRKDDSTHSN